MKSAGKKEWSRRMHIGHANRKQGSATRSALTEMNANKYREGINSAKPASKNKRKSTKNNLQQRNKCNKRQATERETRNATPAVQKYSLSEDKPRPQTKQKLMKTKGIEKQLFDIYLTTNLTNAIYRIYFLWDQNK